MKRFSIRTILEITFAIGALLAIWKPQWSDLWLFERQELVKASPTPWLYREEDIRIDNVRVDVQGTTVTITWFSRYAWTHGIDLFFKDPDTTVGSEESLAGPGRIVYEALDPNTEYEFEIVARRGNNPWSPMEVYHGKFVTDKQ